MSFIPNIPSHQHTFSCWWDHREARWICTTVVWEPVTEGNITVPAQNPSHDIALGQDATDDVGDEEPR